MYETLKKLVQFLGIFSIALTVLFLVYLFKHMDILNDPDALTRALKGHLIIGSIGFLLLQIIQVVIPIIPGGVTTVVGFMAFGPILGFILNYVGIVIGSIILFLLTRRYGKPFILLFVDEKSFKHYEQKLASSTYETVFALNMASPISPADILVMVTGLSRMSFKRFLYIILICKPISIVAFSYFWIYGGRFIKSFL
ncbi:MULTISPECIES: TVP38/TMEM64 family protein [Streptococcus]|nr:MULTISPECIES: VTT domain-containing protein [Streptococcus]MCQ2962572.1 VTT domain-containing protein [Streptococcus sp.]SUN57103.1 membrane protein [Streptococcus equinus]SUO80407.1 membrane protein [Streptococcus equinus]VEE22792.1 membrane protein [Streptococcus equinus]